MAGKSALASYWNGSAWVDIVHPGTSNSAIIGLTFSDVMGTPTIAVLRIQNKAATAGGTGAFSTTFTDFMKIRIKDNESQLIYFYGVVYSLTESYDATWGMVLDLQCRDYLTELKDNSTGGYAGFKVDASVALATYVTNFAKSNIDEDTNLYNTAIGGRSAIIKSLIKATTTNLTFDPADARFVESVAPFEQDENYELGRKNKKSVLQHILSLGATDPHNTTANEQLFGYDFYADPNFTLTTAAHEPTAFFNYFKKGTRPSTDPETYGLKVELPDKTFAPTGLAVGRTFPMQDWEFDRPKGEILTDAVVTYKFLDDSSEDGSTAIGSKTTLFEVLQIKTVANLGTSGSQVPRWKGLPIASGYKDFNEDDGVVFPEWLQVEIDSTWTTVARMQYISKLSGITNAAPAYVLISDVDESIAAAYFNENVVWRAKDNTSTTFTIKSRPRNLYGVKRSLNMTVGESVKPNTVRQTIASALLRNSVQVIRGEFGTIKRPEVYFDDSPASLTGTTTQVLNLSGSTNPLNYGFHVGMPVVKLVSGSIPNTGVVYGYASAVTATEVTVTWNTGSGVSTSDTLRYFVPVRAGDIIYVKNTKVNIPGTKFLVTKVVYSEQIGVSNTFYTVVGAETNTEGGYATKNFQAEVGDALAQVPNLPPTKPNTGNIGESQTSCVFTSTTTNQVNWDEGNLIIGTRTYAIDAGTTASTMIASGDGNTSQSGTTLTAATDYYIYYPGTGTALKTVKKSNYKNVVGAEPDPIVIGWCKAGSIEAEFSVWVQEFTIAQKGDAAKKLTKHSVTSGLAIKGIQGWTTNTVFTATGTPGDYNKIKFGSKADILSASAVSFSDDEAVEDVLTSRSVTWGNGNSSSQSGVGVITLVAGTNYFYKTVGANATANQTLQVTATYSDASSDDKILMAIVVVASSDDGSDSPSIFPFGGNEATISAGVISAGAILAGSIQAGVITTKISSDMTGVTMTPTGLIYSGSKAYEDDNTGFILDGGTSNGRFQIGPNNGNNLKWTGSALNMVGSITGASSIVLGEGSGDIGKVLLKDEAAVSTLQLRAFSNYAYINVFNRPLYILNNYSNTTRDNGWIDKWAAIAPGIADNYLGIPAGVLDHGHGWAALVLQRLDAAASLPDNLGTVAITVPTPAEHAVRFASDPAVSGGTTWDSQIKIVMPVGASFDFNTGTSGQSLVTNGSGTLSWASTMGVHDMWIPAEVMSATVTDGCGNIQQAEISALQPIIRFMSFPNTDCHAQFSVAFPKGWNGGTITYRVYWTSIATDTDVVRWGLMATSMSDNVAMGSAFGTAVMVDDAAQSAANELYVSATSSALTINGSPAAGDLCFFDIFREGTHANDTLIEAARFLGIVISYTTDARTDD